MRLLDVGCGWGGMVRHAATHYGWTPSGHRVRTAVRVGHQARGRRGLGAGRDPAPGLPRGRRRSFDAISSIGMFEHVGRARMEEYVSDLCSLLAPGGRLLNHAIAQPGHPSPPHRRVGCGRRRGAWRSPRGYERRPRSTAPSWTATSSPTASCTRSRGGLDAPGQRLRGAPPREPARALRPHPPPVVANLDRNWDERCARSGPGAPGVALLHAGSAVGFERHNLEIHQVLAVRPTPVGPGCPCGRLRRGGALA